MPAAARIDGLTNEDVRHRQERRDAAAHLTRRCRAATAQIELHQARGHRAVYLNSVAPAVAAAGGAPAAFRGARSRRCSPSVSAIV